jgi:hypothetical protein
MGDPSLAGYKSSTLLRGLCMFAIGMEVTIMLLNKRISIEGAIFLAIYGFGLFVTKAKADGMLKAFGAMAFVAAFARTFFDFGSFNKTTRGNTTGQAITFVGIPNIELIMWIKFLIGCGLLYLSFNMWKK